MKVKKTYRLEQETIDELEKLCSDSGKSATEVIEGAIHDAIRLPDTERAGEGWAQTVAALTDQLAVKDDQIASLGRALEAAQEAAPELPRGLLLDEWRDDWRELTARLGCVSIHLNHKLLDAARVASLKQAGLHILVYTVNKPQRAAELLRWGVDCICTDAIDVIGPNFQP